MVVIVVIGVGYKYFLRPIEAPTAQIGDIAVKLSDGTSGQSGIIYRIGSGSEASFSIYELLVGKDKTVIGTTSDIGGDIRVLDNTIEIGQLSIDARTFQTDSDDRDRALARFILKSTDSANELITFKPTLISGVPAIIPTGKEFSFSVTGDLTISGITNKAVFVTKATITSEELIGSTEAKLKRSDYNLVIPNLSFIANIPDEFSVRATISASKIAI